MGAARFTWDNGRLDNCRFMAQLDRLYMFCDTLPDKRGPSSHYMIHSDNVHSDHKHVRSFSIILEATDGHARWWKMNMTWLKDAKPELQRV